MLGAKQAMWLAKQVIGCEAVRPSPAGHMNMLFANKCYVPYAPFAKSVTGTPVSCNRI